MFKAGALSAAATVGMMATAPAMAAAPVAQANATALTLAVATNPADSGTVVATHDGNSESVEGQANPPISVLDNQRLANIGVLAQEATATVENRDGISAACAGVAGEGGSLAQVGDSWCLTPGETPVNVSIANLDLSGVELIDPESALAPLAELNVPVEQVVGPLTKSISEGLAPLGDLGISGEATAVEGRCTAEPGSAQGSARIVDGHLVLTAGGEQVDLVDLPVNPPANTKVLTNLDVVLATVLDALRTDLENTLDGALKDLGAVPQAVKEQVVDTLIAEIAPQLAPLEENILEVTLNKQDGTADTVEVTALSARVLPAAQEFAGDALVSLDLGRAECGPNARTTAAGPGDGDADEDGGDSDGGTNDGGGDTTDGGTNDGGDDDSGATGDDGGAADTGTPVPTSVDAGTSFNPFAPTESVTNAAALAGLMTAAAGLGLLAYRRWAL